MPGDEFATGVGRWRTVQEGRVAATAAGTVERGRVAMGVATRPLDMRKIGAPYVR